MLQQQHQGPKFDVPTKRIRVAIATDGTPEDTYFVDADTGEKLVFEGCEYQWEGGISAKLGISAARLTFRNVAVVKITAKEEPQPCPQ